MKRFRSLRSRVAAAIVALAVLMVGVHSLALYVISHRLEEGLIDQVVTDELAYLIDSYRRDPTRMPPATETLNGYIVADAAGRDRLPPYLRELPQGLSEVFVDASELHVAVRDEPEGRFILAYKVDHIEQRESQFVDLLYAGLVITAALAMAIGFWGAGRLVRPVRELAQRVGRLETDPPQVPIAQGYRDDELRRLAQAFDEYIVKMATFVEREQEFAANVSHEVRTPVTTIRTSCELLLQDPALSDDARRRIEAIDRAAARLSDNTNSLLFLARSGDSQQAEQISVRDCVSEAAETVIALLRRKGIEFENSVDTAAVIQADRAALLIVLENLLRNAASYTDRGFVRVSYRDGCIAIEDSGPGIDADALPRIGERYFRGARTTADGIGIGLAIVKRICERFDWRLEISSACGHGTRVAVFIPILPPKDQLPVAAGS